jgi:hypothetical protein
MNPQPGRVFSDFGFGDGERVKTATLRKSLAGVEFFPAGPNRHSYNSLNDQAKPAAREVF